jgi:hypothetical protein
MSEWRNTVKNLVSRSNRFFGPRWNKSSLL